MELSIFITAFLIILGGGNFVIPMLIKLDRLLSSTTISLTGPAWILLFSIFITDSRPRDSNRYSRYFWSTDTGLISSQIVLSPLLFSMTSLQKSLIVFFVFRKLVMGLRASWGFLESSDMG